MGISTQSLLAQDVSTGLVGHWRFDGDLNDATSRSNHATSNTSPFFVNGANGEENNALVLDGVNQFLTIQNQSDYAFGTEDFTFATWVNYTSNGYSMCLLDKSTSNLGMCLFLDKNGEGLVTARTRAGNEVTSIGPKINDGAWHLIVFSRETGVANGSPISILTVYIDGQLNNLNEYSSIDDMSNNVPLLVSQSTFNNVDRRYKGKLDDYRCYRRALSQDDITALHETQGRHSSSEYTYYRDRDRDGFGNPNARITTSNSRPPSGYVNNKKDCNDNNANINPNADEICGNGIDDNCDGINDPSVSSVSATNSVQQPNCTNSKGSITTTFSGLDPNKYKVILQDPVSGCMYYMTTLTLNPSASLNAPTVSVTQPNCSTNTGTITFITPASGATYSYDGGVTFVNENSRSGLPTGTYRLCYRDNASGCISKEIEVVIKPGGNSTITPYVSVTQPSCDFNMGSITVTSPSSGVTYSFDNGSTFQNSNVKSGLGSGTYYIRVKDNYTGCISSAVSAVVNNTISPLFAPTVVVTQPTCSNPFGTLTVSTPLTNVSYSFDGGVTFISQNFKSGLAPGTYYICVRDNYTGCISKEAQAIINPAPYGPNAPYISITQPTCIESWGSIRVTSPLSGVTYSFDNGSSYQSSNVKGSLAPGTYYVRVKDYYTGCVSAATTAIINAAVSSNFYPTVSVTQPTCYTPTGTITVTNPTTGVTYSFDGGVTFIPQNSKSGLPPGTYRICVRDNYTGCISKEVQVVINVAPYGPYAPSVRVTQPTCNNGLGSITVTSPLSGVTYSFDNGSSFQYSNVKNGLSPGTYYVRVKDNYTGCVSAYTIAVLNSAVGNSYYPTVVVTQPTCSVPTGTITFTFPLTGVTYSFDGGVTFIAQNSKSGLAPGTYRLCVRDIYSGCISREIQVVINSAPYAPYAPTVSITPLTCIELWGSITVTSPLSGVTYSFDNGATFQNSNVKNSLGAGTYYVRVKDIYTGCVSAATVAVLSNSGGGSYYPTVAVTQPTCSVPTGTITVTSPLGARYTYSFDGGATFIPQNSKSGLVPGTYRICVRDIYTGCISQEVQVTIYNAPYGPNPPTVSITKPTCNGSLGSITVTSPLSGVTYSFDNGASFQTSNVRTGLPAGTYYVKVRDNYSGCVSSATVVVITATVGTSYIPTVVVTQPTCAVPTGTITFTFPLVGVTYSFDGGATFGPLNSKSGLAPGTYFVCVRDIATGCISQEVQVVVNAIPYGPYPPIVSIAHPTCSGLGSITVTSPSGGFMYSFDNGATFQSSNFKGGLAAGTYYVRVKDNATNCVSGATLAVLNGASGGSYAPIVMVTQPTCTTITGTITVTSPTTGVTYSFDGGVTFIAQNSKSGLSPGTYNICVRDIATGCISKEVQVVINIAGSFTFIPMRCYNIVHVGSNKVLGLPAPTMNSGINNGTVVILETPSYMNYQQWTVADVGSGYVKFAARLSGKALTSNTTTEGSLVVQNDYVASGVSDWRIECVGNNTFRLQHRLSGKYLSIQANSNNAMITANTGTLWQFVEVTCSTGSDLVSQKTTTIEGQKATGNVPKNAMSFNTDSEFATELPNPLSMPLQNVRIFPNPANNFIEVQLDKMPEDGFTVTILNTLGSRVSETKSKEGQTLRLNTQNLPNGLYIIQISEKGKPAIRKEIVIQK